ncbi:Ankyrin repeat-containing protein [Artemisia annua]|nr:Ankyrin repeat-containing protein [Artemisia annua]
MVKLLLINGANALMMNDDCQTALDVARVKGFSNVVRAIENHICLFSGWLLEHYGPGFLEVFAPQLLSRKVWVVVLPCGARRLTKPYKLELAIYSSAQDAKPRTIIPLWKANMDEPNFNQPDPAVIISSSSKSRIKLAAVNENEKQQLQRFSNACKGIPQVMHSAFPFNNQGPNVGPAAQTTTTEDPELAMAISASLQSSSVARPTAPATQVSSGSTPSAGSGDTTPHNKKTEKWETHDVGASSSASTSYHPNTDSNAYAQIVPTAPSNITPSLIPSAPPLPDIVDDGPIRYPSIDYTPSDLSETTPAAMTGEKHKMEGDSSSCVICLDAPVEGACIPCGHMAGCMFEAGSGLLDGEFYSWFKQHVIMGWLGVWAVRHWSVDLEVLFYNLKLQEKSPKINPIDLLRSIPTTREREEMKKPTVEKFQRLWDSVIHYDEVQATKSFYPSRRPIGPKVVFSPGTTPTDVHEYFVHGLVDTIYTDGTTIWEFQEFPMQVQNIIKTYNALFARNRPLYFKLHSSYPVFDNNDHKLLVPSITLSELGVSNEIYPPKNEPRDDLPPAIPSSQNLVDALAGVFFASLKLGTGTRQKADIKISYSKNNMLIYSNYSKGTIDEEQLKVLADFEEPFEKFTEPLSILPEDFKIALCQKLFHISRHS